MGYSSVMAENKHSAKNNELFTREGKQDLALLRAVHRWRAARVTGNTSVVQALVEAAKFNAQLDYLKAPASTARAQHKTAELGDIVTVSVGEESMDSEVLEAFAQSVFRNDTAAPQANSVAVPELALVQALLTGTSLTRLVLGSTESGRPESASRSPAEVEKLLQVTLAHVAALLDKQQREREPA